jgi:hypothetical protein
VQAELRRQFRRWGLPNALRVDNGNPWGDWSDLPTALALWLIGLGLDVRSARKLTSRGGARVDR